MAFVAYGGEEIEKEDFEILRAGEFVWEFCTAGNVPEGAVVCGQTAEGKLLHDFWLLCEKTLRKIEKSTLNICKIC